MTYFAHSGSPGDKSDWQRLQEHLLEVAEMAADFARPFGLEKAAYIAGLFHDLGKYDPDFQRRLEGANLSVDHSTAGAAMLRSSERDNDALMAELVMYAVLGHHAGLPDKHNEFGHCLKRRIEGYSDRLDPVWKNEIVGGLTDLMPEQLASAMHARKEKRHAWFDFSVITRLLFSCLVDADFKNTEEFYAARDGRRPDRKWPALQDVLPSFIERFETHMAGMRGESELNRLRGDILSHVRACAAMEPGLFTLTVPTGGGKTLASLGFALDHAKRHGHSRIIYAIPFTSIVDQVADIFRKVLGNEHVLEHHASIDEEHPDRKAFPTSRDRLRLAMEDWAAPVVVTTNVQFFESLCADGADGIAEVVGIIGLVGQNVACRNTFDQRPGLGNVVALAAGENEADGIAEPVDGGMKLGGQAATTSANGLIFRPPFLPVAC